MKNKKKGLLHIIVILAVIALCSFTTLVGFTKAHKGSARNIKLGSRSGWWSKYYL